MFHGYKRMSSNFNVFFSSASHFLLIKKVWAFSPFNCCTKDGKDQKTSTHSSGCSLRCAGIEAFHSRCWGLLHVVCYPVTGGFLELFSEFGSPSHLLVAIGTEKEKRLRKMRKKLSVTWCLPWDGHDCLPWMEQFALWWKCLDQVL